MLIRKMIPHLTIMSGVWLRNERNMKQGLKWAITLPGNIICYAC